MAWLRTLACVGVAASGVTGSCVTCARELDDSAALVQRGYASQDPDRTSLKDPMPEIREHEEFENYVDPNHKVSAVKLKKKQKSKLLFGFDPFKDLVANVNAAISSVKDGLEASTREVVHQAVAEMKDVGQELSNQLKQSMHDAIQSELVASNSAEPASLLESEAGNAHKPKLDANATHNGTHSSKKKKSKKAKIEFNPFKGLISGINQAIDVVKDGIETATRDIVHESKAELTQMGKELSQEFEQMQQDAMGAASGASRPPASLLELAAGSAHKPKLEANGTHNATHSGKKKKSKKAKSEWNPFKDLISGINQAIDVVKDGIETSTREIVHESKAELTQMGKELSQQFEQMQQDAIGTVSAASAPPASLLSLGESAEHKPKHHSKFNFHVNASSNSSFASLANTMKKLTAKREKIKIEFNPFKDMIASINGAIDSIKDNLETSAHDLVHSAAAELEQAGKELKSDFDQTLKQTMQQERPIVTPAPSSQ